MRKAIIATCTSFVAAENNLQDVLPRAIYSYRNLVIFPYCYCYIIAIIYLLLLLYLLIAIHMPMHWVLGKANLSSRVIYIFDSLDSGMTGLS